MSFMNLTRLLEDHFPDMQELQDALRAEGYPSPTLEAMRKWGPRGSCPGTTLAAILALLEQRRGSPVSLLPYMSPGVPRQCPPATSLSSAKPKLTGGPATIFD